MQACHLCLSLEVFFGEAQVEKVANSLDRDGGVSIGGVGIEGGFTS